MLMPFLSFAWCGNSLLILLSVEASMVENSFGGSIPSEIGNLGALGT